MARMSKKLLGRSPHLSGEERSLLLQPLLCGVLAALHSRYSPMPCTSLKCNSSRRIADCHAAHSSSHGSANVRCTTWAAE